MQILRPMNKTEYTSWLTAALPAYAADKVASDRWSREEATELARKEYDQLLPMGLETENNFFLAVLDESGKAVGSLWFTEAPRIGYKVAYVFDIIIHQQYRRQGHASRALRALEVVATQRGLAGVALHVFGNNVGAKALYSELGYAPTNINLYKSLSPPAHVSDRADR